MRSFAFPVVLAAALPFFSAQPAEPAGVRQATACIEVGGVSIWGGIGWNHLVYLTNRCDETMLCRVTTNVEPEPREVSVAHDETALVVMAINSPTQPFVPTVSCDPVRSP